MRFAMLVENGKMRKYLGKNWKIAFPMLVEKNLGG